MNPQEQSNPQADAVFKALAYTENGGKPGEPKAGKTGEMKSTFQFTPDTWKLYSKQVAGQELPLTPEHEAYVVHKKVSDWLAQGYAPQQIASMWNAGERRPNAYKEGHRGINKKYGVAFDTPAYVSKFDKFLGEFSNPSNKLAEENQKASAQIANSELLDRGDKVLNQEQQMAWHQEHNPEPINKKEGLLANIKKKPGKKEGLFKQTSLD